MTLRDACARIITAVVSAVVVVAAVIGYSPTPGPFALVNRGSVDNHVAVIGDSYTTGTDHGGRGPTSWTAQAWHMLAAEGVKVDADVVAEDGAGYGVRGNRGNVFEDLTVKAVKRDDVLVVFFGSRNDQPVDQTKYTVMVGETFQIARRVAPSARFLVIGPPWPTANPSADVLALRDSLRNQAVAVGAVFIDPLAEGWFVGRPDLIGIDGVHPNDAGHAYLAAKIAPLIRNQLTIPV
jgi:lysophospholipase L1-like esterase